MKRKFSLSYTQSIALGFLGVIILGALLLCLPISSRSGVWTGFTDALFTSTSATCVTGLIVFDTYTYWSVFGQVVILLLIQTGGLGLMTIITLFSLFLKRQITLRERRLTMISAGNIGMGGVVKLVKRIALGTLLFEGCGALLLATRFCGVMGLWKGIYSAVFHSVSAFCNAGFDLMGRFRVFSSLTDFSGDIVVNITIMLLIIIGGLGFIVWSDISKNGFHVRNYSLHSKLVLTVTALLLFSGAAAFLLLERDFSLAGMSAGKRILASFFMSVTPRTAGISTVPLSGMSEGGGLLTIILMIIGGSPGSTAGGIKVTTLAVLLGGAWAEARHRENIVFFKRKLDNSVMKQASAISIIHISSIMVGTLILAAVEPYPLKTLLFETVSAAGTVGLSMGITPSLTLLSRIVVMFLMFAGRVGGLSLALVLAEQRMVVPADRPTEKILIG